MAYMDILEVFLINVTGYIFMDWKVQIENHLYQGL